MKKTKIFWIIYWRFKRKYPDWSTKRICTVINKLYKEVRA